MIQIAFCDDDQTVLDQLSALLEKYRTQRCIQIQCTAFRSPLDLLAEIEKGWIIKADTIEELAEKIDRDPAELKATIDAWNAACDAGTLPSRTGKRVATSQQLAAVWASA